MTALILLEGFSTHKQQDGCESVVLWFKTSPETNATQRNDSNATSHIPETRHHNDLPDVIAKKMNEIEQQNCSVRNSNDLNDPRVTVSLSQSRQETTHNINKKP